MKILQVILVTSLMFRFSISVHLSRDVMWSFILMDSDGTVCGTVLFVLGLDRVVPYSLLYDSVYRIDEEVC